MNLKHIQRQDDIEKNYHFKQNQNYIQNQARRNSTAMVQPKSNISQNETNTKLNESKTQIQYQNIKQSAKDFKQQNGAKFEKLAEQKNQEKIIKKQIKIQQSFHQELKQKLNTSQSCRMHENIQIKDNQKQMIISSSSTKVPNDSQDRNNEGKNISQSFINSFQSKKRTMSGQQNLILDENIQEKNNDFLAVQNYQNQIQNQMRPSDISYQNKYYSENKFSLINKPQQYQSEIQEVSIQLKENKQIENQNSGNQIMRNYSDSQNKDNNLNQIYISQKTNQAQLSKFSSNLSSNNKNLSNYQLNLKKSQISGTLGSESTAISQSGRSGERNNNEGNSQQNKANQSLQGVPGIPVHPKMIQQKNFQKSKQDQFNSSGFMTQNQTPNPLYQLNIQSALNKQKQYYSNKILQQKDDISQNENQIKSFQKLQSQIGEESLLTNQIDGYINKKIQKFDFTDYDHQIQEELRIPGENRIKNKNYNMQVQIQRQKQQNEYKKNGNNDLLQNNDSGKTTPIMMLMSEQNILELNQKSQLLQSQRITVNNVNQKQNPKIILKNEQLQEKQDSSNKKRNQTQKYQLGFSKSSDKIQQQPQQINNGNSNNSEFDQTLKDIGIISIDENKMQQYQDVIQNVKLGLDEMKQIIKRQQKNNFQNEKQSILRYESIQDQKNLQKSKEQLAFQQQKDQNNIIKLNIQKNNDRLNNMLKNLEIEIPEDQGATSSRNNYNYQEQMQNDQQVYKLLQQTIQNRRMQFKSYEKTNQDEINKQAFQVGEENLIPSTEKKNSKSKQSAYSIPKSGGGMKMMMTSSHLMQFQGQQNKNIFLSKLQSVSTRNNMRYQNTIDEDLQVQINTNSKYQNFNQNKLIQSNQQIENNSKQDINKQTYESMMNQMVFQHQKIINPSIQSNIQNNYENQQSQNSAKQIEINIKKNNSNENIKKFDFQLQKKSINYLQDTVYNIGSQQKLNEQNQRNKVNEMNPEINENKQDQERILEESKIQKDLKIKVNQVQKGIGIRSGSENNVKISAVYNGQQGFQNADNLCNDSRFGIQPAHKIIIPNDEPTKTSNKRTGIVRAYAANTNQGLVRNYNEDRVSIITNLLPPKQRKDINPEKWPRCSYFGIYDGHGGSQCADFLRDNLHQFVIMEPCFPKNPKEAIINGFAKAEKAFIDKIYNPVTKELTDKSGSCAIVVLIVQDICYVANVGDSRATLSSNQGQKIYPLSLDHKPGDKNEIIRIRKAGGEIYYRTAKNQIVTYDEKKMEKYQQMNLAGPLRVLPGRLSVARTFGDPEAKISELNGNPNVVIHNPEIKQFQIKKEHDFIVLGCDGIFDKMSNNDVVMAVWRAANDNKIYENVKEQALDIHKLCGMGVDYILKNSLLRRSLDNVTVVIIGFSNFKHTVFGHQQQIFDLNKIASAVEEDIEEEIVNVQNTFDKNNQEKKIDKQNECVKMIERTKSFVFPLDQQQVLKNQNQINSKQDDFFESQKKQQIVNDKKIGEQQAINKLTQKKSPASLSTVSSETKRNFENRESNLIRQKANSVNENLDSQNIIQKESAQVSQNLKNTQNQIQGSSYLNSARLPVQKDNKPPLSQNIKAVSLNINQQYFQNKELSSQNLIKSSNKINNLYQQQEQEQAKKQVEQLQTYSLNQNKNISGYENTRRPASTRIKQDISNNSVFNNQQEQEY